MSMRRKRFDISLLFLLLLVFAEQVKSQNTISSPYSKYGIGETDMFTNSVNSAMGGISYALQRNNFVNYKNPASYSGVDTLSFVFDIGFCSNNVFLKSNNAESSGNTGGISHILFAFPLHQTLKIAGGLLPLSTIDFTASETNVSNTETGNYNAIYEGDGGLNKAMLGIAYQPSEKLGWLHDFSLGLNVQYIFGNYYKSATVEFPDDAQKLNSRIESNYRISAFNADLGLQYFKTLKNDNRIGFGLTYVLPAYLPTKNEYRQYTFTESAGAETVRDSVLFTDTDGNIKLPQSFGAGFSYEKLNKLFVGLDFTYTEWSGFSLQDVTYFDVLKDSYKFNVGAEYTPDMYGNYFEKINYRIGANYENGSLYLRDRRISRIGVSLGFGLPIRKQGTRINISLEYGRQGTLENDLIQKDYFGIGVSFSAKDLWFFKKKYQ